jgi:hypothetical protein
MKNSYYDSCQACKSVEELYPVIIKGHQFLFCENCMIGGTNNEDDPLEWKAETERINNEWYEEVGKKLVL